MMAVSKRSTILIFISVAGLLCAFLLWTALTQQKFTVYELNDYGPYGLKAAGLLLQKEGFTPRDIKTVPPNFSGILVINTANQMTTSQQRELYHWIREGGVLIELAQLKPMVNPTKLPEVPESKAGNSKLSVSPVKGLKDIAYYCTKDIFYTVAKPDLGLYTARRRFFIYITSYGAGSIIHWNDPDGITNLNLRNHPDNAVIFVTLVKRYHKTNEIGFYNLANQNAAPLVKFDWGDLLDRYWEAGFLLLLGLILLLWRLSSRFGRPRPLVLGKGRSADEFVYAMASLFQQANAKTVVLDNLGNTLREVIVTITGMPRETEIHILIFRLNQITGKDYGEIALLFDTIKEPGMTKHKFMDMAKKLNAYRRELTEWIKSSR